MTDVATRCPTPQGLDNVCSGVAWSDYPSLLDVYAAMLPGARLQARAGDAAALCGYYHRHIGVVHCRWTSWFDAPRA